MRNCTHAALPLALAAADLVRIEIEMGLGQADRLDDRLDMLLALGAGPVGMDDQGLVQRAP